MPLTDGEKQAYARAKNTIISLWALEWRHPSLLSPIRAVNHEVSVTHTLEADAPVNASESVLFTPQAFTVDVPTVGDQSASAMRVTLDGAPASFQLWIGQARDSTVPIEITMRELLYDVALEGGSPVLYQPSTLHLRVQQARSTMLQVVLDLGRINSANQPFPGEFYTAASNPGLIE